MKPTTDALEYASVKQYCKALRVPVIGANFVPLAEQAVKEKRNHIGYLEALLAMESEERDRHAIQMRLHDARLPRMKTLEEFDFNQAPQIPAAKVRELAEGGYVERAEPVVLMGECGTGKTHLATGLCVAACQQKRRVRFTTAANLVNELVEARQQNAVRRVLARWMACYSWLTGEPKVAFVVFVRKRLPEIQYLRSTISEEQRREFGQLVEDTVAQIEAAQFLPHPGIRFPQNGCTSCPYLGLCLQNQPLVDTKLRRRPGGDLGWLDELEY